jgi:anti-sigma B factor antagonist
MTEDWSFATHPLDVAGRRGCCVEVEGHLDVDSAPRLKAQLLDLLDDGVSHLLVDLRPTASIDSSGLAALVSVHRRLQDGWGVLAVVVADTHIADRFERAGIDRLLTLAPSREVALGLLAGA